MTSAQSAPTAASLVAESHAHLRADLRERVTRSPLYDAPRFAREFESALRAAWLQREYLAIDRAPPATAYSRQRRQSRPELIAR